MPEPVIRAVRDHLDLEARIGGYEAADARADAVAAAYRAVADLLGTGPDHVAFTGNTTESYVRALSSIPFEAGDVILTTRNDYVSNQIQFLSLRDRLGVEVVRAPDGPEGGVDVDAMAGLIRSLRPRLVSVTHVPTSSGLVQDAAAVGTVCRDQDVLYMVDACQSVGQMPVDVDELGCDFLAASTRKFLRGPRGMGFLWVSSAVLDRGLTPLLPDMRAAEWIEEDRFRPVETARRFEDWEFSWALVLGAGEAARYARRIGLEAIRSRVRTLARRLRAALDALEGVRVLDRGPELAGIVSAAVDGRDPDALVRELRELGVNASAQVRSTALLDMEEKGVDAQLRMSPHYFNTEDEVERAVEALDTLLPSRP